MATLRVLYAPAYFLTFVAGAAMLVSAGASSLWLIGLLLAAIATSLITERIAPFEAEWDRSQRHFPRSGSRSGQRRFDPRSGASAARFCQPRSLAFGMAVVIAFLG